MLKIDFKSDFDKLRKELKEDQKQVRFAAMLALNRTAKDTKEGLRKEMGRVFDRPTRFTLNSLRTISATRQRLVAMVWVKDEFKNDALRYLGPQIEGGPRKHKPFEKRLIRQGLMPATLFAVPARGTKLDSHGNIRGGDIERILSALGAAEQLAGYSANRTARSAKRHGKKLRNFFVAKSRARDKVGVRRGNMHFGIWERKPNGSVEPVIMFVSQPRYAIRLKFNEVGLKVAEAAWPRRLAEALDQTLRTVNSKTSGSSAWRSMAGI